MGQIYNQSVIVGRLVRLVFVLSLSNLAAHVRIKVGRKESFYFLVV